MYYMYVCVIAYFVTLRMRFDTAVNNSKITCRPISVINEFKKSYGMFTNNICIYIWKDTIIDY